MKVTFKNEAQITAFKNEQQIQKYVSQGKISEKHVEFLREYVALLKKYGITETFSSHKESDYLTADEPCGDGAICHSIPIPGEDDFEDIFVGDVCDGHVILYPSEYTPEGIEIWF